MIVKYPGLRCALEQHSVDTKSGTMAGFLVRCASSRNALGFVWSAGSSWRWKTPDALSFGERSTQHAAVKTLREIADLKATGCAQQSTRPLLDALDADSLDALVDDRTTTRPRVVHISSPRPVRVTTTTPDAPAPALTRKHDLWGSSATAIPDLTSAIRNALQRAKDAK